MVCSMMDKKDKWRIPRRLCHSAITSIIPYIKNVKSIYCGETDADGRFDMLTIYQASGKNERICVEAENQIRSIGKKLKNSLAHLKIFATTCTLITRFLKSFDKAIRTTLSFM